MIEDGPDAFMKRWREYASDAVLFARAEGSPLLEAEVGGTVVQLFERTNPYLANPGAARVLVNPTATLIEAVDEGTRELVVPTRGTVAGRGRVVDAEGRIVVVDVGTPILVACEQASLDDVATIGAWVRFEAALPIHGFVVSGRPRPGPVESTPVDEAH